MRKQKIKLALQLYVLTLWYQILLYQCLAFSSLNLPFYKKWNWLYFLIIKRTRNNIFYIRKTNIEIVWRAYIAKLISTWSKFYLSRIYCSFIWFNYIRIKNQKKYFWFGWEFKITFVIKASFIRTSFASGVTTILLPVKAVYVT